MYNQDIVEAMIEKFGLARTATFCQMQSYYFKLLALEFAVKRPGGINEYEFERDWFKKKYDELSKQLNHNENHEGEKVHDY